MSTLSVSVQQKFTNLRKKLDQLGYMQPLSLDSLPLVESLFMDFVWTTESFRKCKAELDKRIEVRERVEEYVEPYKADNARLLNEHNRVQKRLLEMRVEHEETIQGLHTQIRHLEQQKYDLALFNQQCLDKLNKYESEAKHMVQKIMVLQEKNFQAVVHTPEGKRKQIPFRRQRMDIDYFIPRDESNGGDNEEYCCAVPKEQCGKRNQQSDSGSSDQIDLLETITNKCKELSNQLSRAEEELELSDRKINSYCEKLKMYEEEISRLSRELSCGRSLEAVSSDSQQRSRDRVVDQLNVQLDLLQQRNEELEQEILRLNAINIKEDKFHSVKIVQDNDCMVEIQNRKLRNRIDELVEREKSLLKELRCSNSKLEQIKSEVVPGLGESADMEISSLRRHICSLEDDRDYWRKQAESRGYDKSSTPSRDTEDLQIIKEELINCQREMTAVVCQNNELRQMLNVAERNSTPPPNDKDRSRDLEIELKKSRAERNKLQNLLDKFERQLLDIQGNIRVLTQERDMLNEKYEECQKELHDMRKTIIQSEKPKKDGTGQPSLAAQTLLRRLELEKDDALRDLHKMTTERDSLRERLKTVTETALTEKARLSQRLEDIENQKERLCQDNEEMIEKLTILRNKIGELEEYNHQLIKRNDCLTGTIDNDRVKLQNMAADIQKLENDVQLKTRQESQLAGDLKAAENRLVTLQQRTEAQNTEMTNFKTDISRLKEILNDVDKEKDQMQIEVDSKSEQLRDIQGQLKLKEDALDEVRMNMNSLEQQLRRIQDVNNHRDKELRALVMHNEQLENDLRHEVSKCDQLKAENCRINEDLLAITKEHHRLQAEYRDCKRCIMECNQEKDQLEQRLSHCQAAEAEQQKQNNELMDQYRHLSLENDKLQLTMQRIDGKNAEFTNEIDAREKIVRNMREQLLAAEGEIQGLQCNVRHLEDQVSSLRQVLGNSNQATENHSLEKQEIIKELVAMRDLCARLENNKDTIQRQLSSRLLELEQLKAENADISKENENLREEMDCLRESIQSLETVMSAGREKEFRNQMEYQQRISELEAQNEELTHLQTKVQQMNRDLGKCNGKCNELEAECERLRRQLTSERFKLELANQELLRKQKVNPSGYAPEDVCDRFEPRSNEVEYYSSNVSPSENQCQITSTGFFTDHSGDILSHNPQRELLCTHGCYHNIDCKNIAPGKHHSEKCGHGCRHSEECMIKKQRLKNEERRRNTIRRSCNLLQSLDRASQGNYNCSNTDVDGRGCRSLKEHLNAKSSHVGQKCRWQSVIKSTQTEIEGELKSSQIIEKLPTIISESGSIDADNNSNVTTSVSRTSTVDNCSVNSVMKDVNMVTVPVSERLDIKDEKGNQLGITIAKNDIKTNAHGPSLDNRTSANTRQSLSHLSTVKCHVAPSAITNDTPLSMLSRVTQSTKNPQASSTLAQVPSLSKEYDEEQLHKFSNENSVHVNNEEQTGTKYSRIVTDVDPTDVSQSLSHSFYDVTDELVHSIDNSSSGVHTGRSFANHTPTSIDNNVIVAPSTPKALVLPQDTVIVPDDDYNDNNSDDHSTL